MIGVNVEKIESVHSDERGIITDILNKDIGHVGIITCNKDSSRANHYHKQSIQYSYILSGKFEVLIASIENTKDVEKVILNAGEIITIQPGIVHTFNALEDSSMLDMVSQSREGFGYENDVVKGIFLKKDE